MERRLTAIMSADLVGYSRLVRSDEEGTISTFKSILTDHIDPVFGKYNGRMVKLMGDGMLVAFSSVVDAVRAGVEMQQAIADYNTERPQDARFDFRVGINLGDVVIDGNDIHGDGVNLAARLEGLAESGGINISGSVYEQVRDRVEYQFTDLGEQTVKNIDRPLRVWRWLTDQQGNTKAESSRKLLALPDKPSIAVLPFDNMSGDADQEYFADGITEDIITALSKFRWFFVIARNSTFVYKGQAIDISQVGRELGVRYVLEGSVRKSADRVRITAQLIESESGNHVWAERYDRSLTEIFELQDEITSTIAAAVEPELAGVERERALRKPTEDLGAWDLFQRGVALVWRQQSTSIDAGGKLIRQAVELDPDFGQAHGYLAFVKFLELIYEWAENHEVTLQQGISDASKAISMDQRDYFAHHALGRLSTLSGDRPAAIRSLETSVGINPNFALGYVGLGEAHVYGGDPHRAIEYLEIAMRLSPNDPMMWDMLHYEASAYIRLDDFDQAIQLFEKVCQYPAAQYVSSATLAALYVLQDREAEGEKALRNARRLEPGLSIDTMKKVYGVTEERAGSRTQRLIQALRTAGLGEE